MNPNIHWQYLLILDHDFGSISRYIEPCEKNFDTYSLEIARLIMAATQECDVLLKQLCKKVSTEKAENENDYRKILMKEYPSISKIKIEMEQFQLQFTPYKSWEGGNTPEWWTVNNKIKHHRATDYNKATLKNLMEAIAGLFVANLYYYRDKKNGNLFALNPMPKYFTPQLDSMGSTSVMVRDYCVPD